MIFSPHLSITPTALQGVEYRSQTLLSQQSDEKSPLLPPQQSLYRFETGEALPCPPLSSAHKVNGLPMYAMKRHYDKPQLVSYKLHQPNSMSATILAKAKVLKSAAYATHVRHW